MSSIEISSQTSKYIKIHQNQSWEADLVLKGVLWLRLPKEQRNNKDDFLFSVFCLLFTVCCFYPVCRSHEDLFQEPLIYTCAAQYPHVDGLFLNKTKQNKTIQKSKWTQWKLWHMYTIQEIWEDRNRVSTFNTNSHNQFTRFNPFTKQQHDWFRPSPVCVFRIQRFCHLYKKLLITKINKPDHVSGHIPKQKHTNSRSFGVTHIINKDINQSINHLPRSIDRQSACKIN